MTAAWKSMESAPKDGREMLLFSPKAYGRRGQLSHSAWVRIGRLGDSPNRPPTLWHPLPDPPAEGT